MELITHSKRSAFKNCRRYYFHRNVEHLELRSQKTGRRRGTMFGDCLQEAQLSVELGLVDLNGDPLGPNVLPLGEIVHTCLQRAYTDLVDGGVTDSAELEVEIVKIECIALAYLRKYGIDKRREVEFNLPLVNPSTKRSSRKYRLAGKIDGVVNIRDFNGTKKATIIEDKLMQSIQRPMIEKLSLDHQTTEYVDAFMQRGWVADVDYRITRMPGMNPKPPKEFKTKADYPGESLEEFAVRLSEDIEDKPESYFYHQLLMFPTEHLDDYRKGRWQEAQDIMETMRSGRWYQNTSRCSDWGGCEFVPLCTKMPDARALYTETVDNSELSQGGK